MRNLTARAQVIAIRRAARHADTLAQAAAAELPADLHVQRIADGIAVRGPALVQRLAFDGRLRGLTLGLKERFR